MELTQHGLTLKEVAAFLDKGPKIRLSKTAKKAIKASRAVIEAKLKDGKSYYGINTGFGKLATQKISAEHLVELQENIIFSHAMAVGEPLAEPVARLTLLLHAASLARGFSGVRLEVPQAILHFLNHQITPVIPEKGSLGASGDLALLGHMALSLMGKGEVFYKGKKRNPAGVLKECGLKPLHPQAKEGLALVNGLAVSVATALIQLLKTERLLKLADIVAAVSIEGDSCSFQPFQKNVLQLRAQPGVLQTGANLRQLLAGSAINKSHAACARVQDPYSFRCIPQVHGAVKDVFHFAKQSLERELGSVTDNPLVFSEDGSILSGGNFHGESIAFAADFLSIALSEVGAISERRLAVLLQPLQGEIPTPFLTQSPGLHSGLMTPHYVVTNLALENKMWAHPASIDSLPTSGGQEDHVSQSCWAAQKLEKITANVETILAIELWASIRAINLSAKGKKPGKGVCAIWQYLSKKLPRSFDDKYLRNGFEIVREFVAAGEVLSVVEEAVGEIKV